MSQQLKVQNSQNFSIHRFSIAGSEGKSTFAIQMYPWQDSPRTFALTLDELRELGDLITAVRAELLALPLLEEPCNNTLTASLTAQTSANTPAKNTTTASAAL